jgi:hypothetical protein
VSGYGVGLTGGPGMGVADRGTLQRHAVVMPWPQGAPHGYAVCGRRVVLNWIWGQPMRYSFTDGYLCVACATAVKAGRK